MKIEIAESFSLPTDGEASALGSIAGHPLHLVREDGKLVVRAPFADNVCASNDDMGVTRALGELVAFGLRLRRFGGAL